MVSINMRNANTVFPLTRLRRSRKHSWYRSLVRENLLNVTDLIYPLFVNYRSTEEITAMPNIYRYSIDDLIKIIDNAINHKIKAILLFPNNDPCVKTESGSIAFDENNLVCNTIKEIRKRFSSSDIGIISDIALDPYTTHGHDGVLDSEGCVDNDQTIIMLQKQALALANAGCDCVAPSDMMDGRIASIRRALDKNNFQHVLITSYAVKYTTCFYNPFRNAVGSKCTNVIDKTGYQVDFCNINESMHECKLDIEEGADSLIIKPASHYLDIIYEAKNRFQFPIFGYHVSGEYTMLKFAADNECINYNNALYEILSSIKRAGADAIITYAALDAAQIIKNMGF